MSRTLIIGRFQPFHRGHLAVVEAARRQRPGAAVILGVGSAQASFTPTDPFTAGERTEMIELALREAGLSEVTVVPIPDIHRHALWAAHVVALVPQFDVLLTNNPLTRLLFGRAGVTVESVPWVERAQFQGAVIRAAMRTQAPWEPSVPSAVAKFLTTLGGPARVRLLGPESPGPPDVGEA
ncbi:MAG: nicotinamide-nucleotide adenylyltransferase [Thermoplasmata archaeon]|nr:nicotinamide-nucleotide adenylyltransferase [Thermoplasmata archaeon]